MWNDQATNGVKAIWSVFIRAGCFTCFPPQSRRKSQTPQMLALLAHLRTNGKKMLKLKLWVPSTQLNYVHTPTGVLFSDHWALSHSPYLIPPFLVPTTGTLYFWAPMQWLTRSQKNTTQQKAKFWTMWATTVKFSIPINESCCWFYLCNLCSFQESEGSVAVRMALGETQIVQETRQFLLDNNVCLDSFSQVCDMIWMDSMKIV